MRLALQETSYYVSNLLSLAGYVIAISLAVVVGTDEEVLAAALLAGGIASLGFDGIFAKWSGSGLYDPGSWQDMVVTAGSSTLLTYGSLVWLIRADYVPWWTVIILTAAIFGPEFLYIGRRKAAGKPFVPVVLFASLAYWIAVMVVYGEMAGLPVYVAPLGLFLYGLIYLRCHFERLLFFKAESDALIPSG